MGGKPRRYWSADRPAHAAQSGPQASGTAWPIMHDNPAPVVATGLAQGPRATTDLIEAAVQQALDQMPGRRATSVLLFLSADFAADPQPALRAAARKAACLQIAGCSASGIFTEREWIIDAPAAAALVLAAPLALTLPQPHQPDVPSLCLAAPNAVNTNWLHATGKRYGGVAGDITGRGQYKVWDGGKPCLPGKTELQLAGMECHLLINHGLQQLSPVMQIDSTAELDIHRIGNQPATDTLDTALANAGATRPTEIRLCVLCGEDAGDDADFYPLPLITSNTAGRAVTVAQRLQPGQRVFWARRSTESTQQQLAGQLARHRAAHGQPAFGLVFSCVSRGAHFFAGQDRDWELLRHNFPSLPLLGLYGNGQFAPLADGNRLLDGSLVVALFHGAKHVQPIA